MLLVQVSESDIHVMTSWVLLMVALLILPVSTNDAGFPNNKQLNSCYLLLIFPILDIFSAVSNGTMTLRERDTTDQLIGKIDDVIAVVAELCSNRMDWEQASKKLEKYSGVQEVDA